MRSALPSLIVLAAALSLGAADDPPPPAPADRGLIVTRTGPRSYNIDAPGNLAPNRPFTGRTLSEIVPENNPVDLLGQAMVLAKADPKAAHDLFMAASLRAAFDIERVEDPTARGAWNYLLSQPGPKDLKLWGALTRKLGQADQQAVVAWAQKSGPPTYHPGWMVQHGMRAINGEPGKGDKGIRPDFDPAEAWTKVCAQAAATADDNAYWAAREQQTTPAALQAMLGFLEKGVGKNLDARAPSTAAVARERVRQACAKFDPKSDDPAWQFVVARAESERIFEEAYAEHARRRDVGLEKSKAGK